MIKRENLSRTISSLTLEFQERVAKIFEDNLVFAFIGGGVAKGYADYSHDIDMVVVCRTSNPGQEASYKRLFYELHKDYGFKPESYPTLDISFGIPAPLSKFETMLSILDGFTVTSVVRPFQTFEAVVWGDMLSGKIVGKSGNLQYLAKIQRKFRRLKKQWRREIIANCIDSDTLAVERSFIEGVDISLLFERFVTYLKLKGVGHDNQYKATLLGTVHEATMVVAQHPGCALSPLLRQETLNKCSPAQSAPDVLVLPPCAQGIEACIKSAGNVFSGKVVLDISNEFLAPYMVLKCVEEAFGAECLPQFVVSLKMLRNCQYGFSFYPQERQIRTKSYGIVESVLGIPAEALRPYRSILHAALDAGPVLEFSAAGHDPTVLAAAIEEANAISTSVVGHGFQRGAHVENRSSCIAPSATVVSRYVRYLEELGDMAGIKTPVLSALSTKGDHGPRELCREDFGIFAGTGKEFRLNTTSPAVRRMLTEETRRSIESIQAERKGKYA